MPKRKPARRPSRARTPLERASARHERAVDRLCLSETLYHSLVEHLPQCILRKDARGTFTFANRKFCELLGLTSRQVLGKTDYDFFPKELADKYRKDDIIVMETGEIFETEEANKPPGQKTRYVHVMKAPLRDHHKRVIGVQVLFWDVTAHHRAEETLAHQAALMDALMDTVPDHIFFKDADGRFLRINLALAAEHGLDDPAKAVGKCDFDFYPREEAERFRQDEQTILSTGQPLVTHEEQKTYPNGRVLWTSTTKMPIRDKEGRVVGIFGISHNITPLKKAEEGLAEQAYLMDSLMGNVPDYIYFKDLQSRFTRVSRAQSARFGLKDPAEAAGRTDSDFFTREHAESALRDEQEIIRSGRPIVAKEEKETFPDGSERWVSTTKMPIRDKAGRTVGTFGLSHDITGLKEAKDALAEQADLLNTLLDNVPDFIYFKDTSSRFLRVNRALAVRHGFDAPHQLEGLTDADLFTPEHAGPALRDEQEIMRTGRPIVGKEEKETYPDGSVKWVSTTKMPLRDKNGRIVGTFGVTRDITGLKRTEEALAVQAELLTTLMEGVPDRIFFKDAQSRFLRVNRAQAERFGLTDPAQAVGRTDFDYFPREEAERFLHDEREIMRTGVPMVGKEEKRSLPDGTVRWTSSTKLLLRDRDGRVVGTFGINRDITGLKRAEEALAEQAELLNTLLDNVPDFSTSRMPAAASRGSTGRWRPASAWRTPPRPWARPTSTSSTASSPRPPARTSRRSSARGGPSSPRRSGSGSPAAR